MLAGERLVREQHATGALEHRLDRAVQRDLAGDGRGHDPLELRDERIAIGGQQRAVAVEVDDGPDTDSNQAEGSGNSYVVDYSNNYLIYDSFAGNY